MYIAPAVQLYCPFGAETWDLTRNQHSQYCRAAALFLGPGIIKYWMYLICTVPTRHVKGKGILGTCLGILATKLPYVFLQHLIFAVWRGCLGIAIGVLKHLQPDKLPIRIVGPLSWRG
ncbi:hypothetical protein B0T24DRAFT_612258 [Lasiosphaeria ovina]|uniref:Uncharacterized protein n=1 Tax=Lasiosphaeria ovina TaxID=92902 RepID=A0AAE0NDM6_9PEZI|nr:hypothetical protein B0T24DRAFT_612258 [Lasiosphaeria ovina]